MSRTPEPALDQQSNFIKKGVHRDPFSVFTVNAQEWLDHHPSTEKVMRIDLLDSLDVQIKGALFLGSPLNTEIAVGGPLNEPDEERLTKLFKFFAPLHWCFHVLRNQMKGTLGGDHYELVLSPQLKLFEEIFYSIGRASSRDNPCDFKVHLSQAIWGYYKAKAGSSYNTERTKLYYHTRKQNDSIDNFFRTTKEKEGDLCLAFQGDSLVGKESVLLNTKLVFSAKYKNLPMRYFIRQCFHPDKGPFVFLYLSLPDTLHREEIETYLIKRHLEEMGGWVDRPNLKDVSVGEYLKGFVQIEKLVRLDRKDFPQTRRVLRAS